MSISVIKGIKTFFEDNTDGFGRKVTIEEFKALSNEDKSDFVNMLRDNGMDIDDYVPSNSN